MQEYLSSKEACEKLCEMNRPNFRNNAIDHFIYAGFIISVFLFGLIFFRKYLNEKSLLIIVSVLSIIVFVYAIYIIKIGILFLNISKRSDGKYLNDMIYKPSAVDYRYSSIKYLYALDSFSDLRRYWDKAILMNNVFISDSTLSLVKKNQATDFMGPSDEYRQEFLITCSDETCKGEYEFTIDHQNESTDPKSYEINQEKPLLLFGNVYFGLIRVQSYQDAMVK